MGYVLAVILGFCRHLSVSVQRSSCAAISSVNKPHVKIKINELKGHETRHWILPSKYKTSSAKKSLVIKTIVFFSIMTPIGIIIGTVLDNIESSRISIWFEAIFDSLAAGTFIYIAVLEIIDDVFANGKFRYQKFAFLLFGFLLMAFIAIYA